MLVPVGGSWYMTFCTRKVNKYFEIHFTFSIITNILSGFKSVVISGGNEVKRIEREKSNGYIPKIVTDLSSMQFFGFKKVIFPPLPKKSNSHSMVITNDGDILICGINQMKEKEEFCTFMKRQVTRYVKAPDGECLKLEKDKWVHHSTLNLAREDCIAITMPNGVYLFGGNAPKTVQGEFLKNGSNTWEMGPSLHSSWNGVHFGKISGLRISEEEFVLIGVGQRKDTVVKFNIIQKDWTVVMKLKIPRLAHTCALINNKIIISSGANQSRGPNNCIVAQSEIIYLPSWNSRVIRDESERVCYDWSTEQQFGVVTFRNQERLVSFGRRKCKIWNDLKEEWEFIEPELRLNRSAYGILSLPSTMLIHR